MSSPGSCRTALFLTDVPTHDQPPVENRINP